ncbi:hypothetical protein GQ53DRAFT_849091 [Thozetella sp. PMI_491]|nr:hypothetical protein GQ53DRAFT_849091 [Thozetella sp. PMI_491]
MDSVPDLPTRSRVFACNQCSRRKQKCDKQLPICGQCQKTGAACQVTDKENSVVHLEEIGVTKKGYVRLLEERLALLEEKVALRDAAGERGLDELAPVPNSVLTAAEHIGPPMSADLDHLEQSQPLHATRIDMNSLSLSAMAEPKSRAGEFLKELSISRIIAAMTETYAGNPESTSRLDRLWDGIARDIRHPADAHSHRLSLDRDEALRWLDSYLELVDFRFPRIAVAKVRHGIAAITAADGDLYQDTLSKNPAHIFMAYMVVAIVPLVSENYPISHGSFVSIHILAMSLRVLERVFRQEDGIDIIQCLHLLVIFSIHSSTAGSSWHLIGFAMAKCIALGYHRDSIAPSELSEESEQRKWAFWGCYLLDRLICSALDRPLSIDDRDVTVSLPGELGKSPTSLSRAENFHVHMFQWARLLSSVLLDFNAANFGSHLSHTLYWRAMTPEAAGPDLQKQTGYHTSQFNALMLRTAIQHVINLQPPDPALLIRQGRVKELKRIRLIEICGAMVQSLNRASMSRRPYLSMVTGYTAFASALSILYCDAVINSVDLERQNLLDSSCHKLDIVSRQFPRMQDYRRLVDMLRQRTLASCMKVQGSQDQGNKDHVNGLIAGIGPEHLKRLARVVLDWT